MGRKAGVDVRATRAAILRASLVFFSRRDFSDVTLEEIAREVGITKGAVYWHFPTKDALFEEVLRDIGRRWRDAVLAPVLAGAGPREQIDQLFDSYDAFLGRNPAVCHLLARGLLSADAARSRSVRRVFRQTRQAVARVIESGRTSDAVRADADPSSVAQAILAVLLGTQLLLAKGNSAERRAVFAEAKQMAQLHLFG